MLASHPRHVFSFAPSPISSFVLSFAIFFASGSCELLAQRELTDIPVPNPEVELATFQMGDGWKAELFAGDPSLAKPIHMNWDASGRLWVASSATYPQVKPGEASNDKILILEDSNRDGVADKTIVFADKLLIPTGVLPANDGPHASAYVANSDQLLYLVDRDGDLVADERHVILSGFGTEDTHHLLHSLRWGHDGWLYMNQSIYIHSHIETPWGVERLNGGGIWRYHPATKRLEIYARGFVNPWGTHFDRYGQVFATDGAYGEGINYVFPGSVFVTAVGGKRFVSGLNPGSPKHCSLEILSGSHWPESIRGSMVTNDFRAHRVCRFNVSEDRSGYESVQQQEIIKTPHVSFRPIDAKQGLDGALYIADWYNPIIQHGEVDFRDPRRDRTHGRIWRITHRDQKPTVNEPITPNDSFEKNMQRLSDDADLVRLFASQALRVQSKSNPAVMQRIQARIQELATTKSNPLELLQLLWLIQGENQFHSAGQSALLSSDNGQIRAAAVRLLSHNMVQELRKDTDLGKAPAQSTKDAWLNAVRPFVTDAHPRVRLESVRMLSLIETPEAVQAACQVLAQPIDRFLDFALWQTIRDLKSTWLPAFQSGQFHFGGSAQSISFALRAIEEPTSIDAMIGVLEAGGIQQKSDAIELMRLIAELGQPQHYQKLLGWIIGDSAATKLPKLEANDNASVLRSLLDMTKRRKQHVPMTPALLEQMTALLKNASADSQLSLTAIESLGQWQVAEARPLIVSLVEKSPVEIRKSAIGALASFADEAAKNAIAKLSTDSDLAIATVAMEHLVDLDIKLACETVSEKLASAKEPDVALTKTLQLLLSKKTGAADLAVALSNKKLVADVGRSVRSILRSSGNASEELIATIDRVASLNEHRWVWNETLRDQWLELAKTKGNAARGEMIYRRSELQCSQCHKLGGVGGSVGPELTGIGANAPADYLIEALIAPAAKVKEGYHAKVVKTDDDEIITGIPVRESDNEVVFRVADGKERGILKQSIEETKDARSLMPDGLLDTLSQDEAIDLVRFMIELGRIDGTMPVVNDGSIRAWQVLNWTQPAHVIFNRNSLDAVTGNHAQFVWQPLAALVSGDVPLAGLGKFQPHADTPPTTFLQTQLDVTRPGKLVLDLGSNGKKSVSLWVNGAPTPVTDGENAINVVEGKCMIHVGINRTHLDDRIKIKVLADKSTAKVTFN